MATAWNKEKCALFGVIEDKATLQNVHVLKVNEGGGNLVLCGSMIDYKAAEPVQQL